MYRKYFQSFLFISKCLSTVFSFVSFSPPVLQVSVLLNVRMLMQGTAAQGEERWVLLSTCGFYPGWSISGSVILGGVLMSSCSSQFSHILKTKSSISNPAGILSFFFSSKNKYLKDCPVVLTSLHHFLSISQSGNWLLLL